MSPARSFADRREAGRQLASRLLHLAADRPVVIGMARGGVLVAQAVAEALQAPLDVIVVRKIGAPFQPEFAVGAIARGVIRLDHDSIRQLRISQKSLTETVARELAELTRREWLYRGGRAEIDVKDRVVIVVDDGLATGLSALAAIEAIRARSPARIVFATPVAAPESVPRLRAMGVDVVSVLTPPEFRTVGEWYEDFAPTSDDEVIELLAVARPGDRLAGDERVSG